MLIKFDTRVTTPEMRVCPGRGLREWHYPATYGGKTSQGDYMLNHGAYVGYFREQGVENSFLFAHGKALYTRDGTHVESLGEVWYNTDEQRGLASVFMAQERECITALRLRKLALLTDD